MSFAHIQVIVNALEELLALPEVYADHLDEALLHRAEDHLIALAEEHTPAHVRRLAAHLAEVIAPEAAEEIEGRRLALMEQRAEQAMGVTIRREVDGIAGLTEVRLRVPDAVGCRFRTLLETFTNPRVTAEPPAGSRIPRTVPDGERIPHPRRLAMAFGHLLESLDPDQLPLHGGDATTVMVTISLDSLRADLAAAGLGLGEEQTPISASEARRLACTAKLVPVVLGSRSEILDLGRSARLYSRAQRRAMALRDQCCRAEGCSVPATWCEAHHFGQPWAHGGRTDLADGRLLCRWHHQRAHDDRYLHRQLPNGDLRFSRRT